MQMLTLKTTIVIIFIVHNLYQPSPFSNDILTINLEKKSTLSASLRTAQTKKYFTDASLPQDTKLATIRPIYLPAVPHDGQISLSSDITLLLNLLKEKGSTTLQQILDLVAHSPNLSDVDRQILANIDSYFEQSNSSRILLSNPVFAPILFMIAHSTHWQSLSDGSLWKNRGIFQNPLPHEFYYSRETQNPKPLEAKLKAKFQSQGEIFIVSNADFALSEIINTLKFTRAPSTFIPPKTILLGASISPKRRDFLQKVVAANLWDISEVEEESKQGQEPKALFLTQDDLETPNVQAYLENLPRGCCVIIEQTRQDIIRYQLNTEKKHHYFIIRPLFSEKNNISWPIEAAALEIVSPALETIAKDIEHARTLGGNITDIARQFLETLQGIANTAMYAKKKHPTFPIYDFPVSDKTAAEQLTLRTNELRILIQNIHAALTTTPSDYPIIPHPLPFTMEDIFPLCLLLKNILEIPDERDSLILQSGFKGNAFFSELFAAIDSEILKTINRTPGSYSESPLYKKTETLEMLLEQFNEFIRNFDVKILINSTHTMFDVYLEKTLLTPEILATNEVEKIKFIKFYMNHFLPSGTSKFILESKNDIISTIRSTLLFYASQLERSIDELIRSLSSPEKKRASNPIEEYYRILHEYRSLANYALNLIPALQFSSPSNHFEIWEERQRVNLEAKIASVLFHKEPLYQPENYSNIAVLLGNSSMGTYRFFSEWLRYSDDSPLQENPAGKILFGEHGYYEIRGFLSGQGTSLYPSSRASTGENLLSFDEKNPKALINSIRRNDPRVIFVEPISNDPEMPTTDIPRLFQFYKEHPPQKETVLLIDYTSQAGTC